MAREERRISISVGKVFNGLSVMSEQMCVYGHGQD